jgi:DNA-binding FadR family transcriptional regulator
VTSGGLADEVEPPAFLPIQKKRASEAIVEQLEAMIYEGVLKPGAPLPAERQLMVEFGVSRPTLREALRVAESTGLIAAKTAGQGGQTVLGRPTVPVTRAIQSLLRAHHVGLADVIELRMVVEGAAAQLAAVSATGEPLDALAAAYDDLAAAETRQQLAEADGQFHVREAEASGNPLLTVIVGALRESILDTIAQAQPSLGEVAREITLQRHGDILAAIRSGDGARACYLSRLSLLLTYGPLVGDAGRSRLESVLESGPPPDDRSEDWILGPGQTRPSTQRDN